MSKKASIVAVTRGSNMSSLNKELNQGTDPQSVCTDKDPLQKITTSKPIESKIPRGQRGGFQKLTISMPAEMVFQLKTIGARRKAAGGKDCDTSALIRESLAEWIIKQN